MLVNCPDVRPKHSVGAATGGGMEMKILSPPTLEGPDLYHVYIGHHNRPQTDQNRLQTDSLYTAIASKLAMEKFEIYPRSVSQQLDKDDIDDGIASSQKTVLMFTTEYLEDRDMYHYEKKIALDKAVYRGAGSLIVLLCGLAVEDLDERFSTYSIINFNLDGSDNEESIQNLLYILSTDILPDPRNTIKTNMGYSLACSYFYGYLRCILPGLAQRISDSNLMEVDGKVIMCKKLFIIMPESCFCPVKMSNYDEVKSVVHHIPFNVSHAGSAARDYKSPVCEIQKDKGQMYRAAIEFASCLSVLWDMMHDPDGGITQREATREMQLFFFYLKCFLAKNRDLERRVHLIYFIDKRQSFSDVVLTAIAQEVAAEIAAPMDIGQASLDALPIGFREEENHHLKVISEQSILAHYSLKKTGIRGKAIIINVIRFECSDPPLLYREGSTVDVEKMKALFTTLNFEVEVYENNTATEIKALCAGLETHDFSGDQAIMICVMSHGVLGQVYGADGNLVSIVDITVNLTNNDTLKGKPKIFFIQACQRGVKDKSGANQKENSSDNNLNIQVVKHDPAPESGDSTNSLSRVDSSSNNNDPLDNSIAVITETGDQAVMNFVNENHDEIVNNVILTEVLEFDSDRENGERDTTQADLVPGAPDFIMSYATLPGYLSFRHTEVGSLYITFLDKKIREHRQNMPLDRILMKVTEAVKDETNKIFPLSNFEDRQFPVYLQTTDRLVYF